MNLNKLAKIITLEEGGKISLPIGQVKEVMKILLTELGKLEDQEIIKIVNRYRR